MFEETEENKTELISASTSIMALTRGEIDSQVATARAFPRSIAKFQKEAEALACFDEETAASMRYCLKRGDKQIEGGSIRLAEIAAYAWGNLRAESNIESIDETHVTAVGMVHDLERNVAYRHRVKRKILDKYGKRYSQDMIGTTCNAACSIALREAIFKAVPRVFINQVYEKAKIVAIGNAASLRERIARVVALFGQKGVTEKQILIKLGRNGLDEITLDDLGLLQGYRTSINDGDSTIEEVFAEPELPTGATALNDKIKGKKAGKKADSEVKTETQEPNWKDVAKVAEEGLNKMVDDVVSGEE